MGWLSYLTLVSFIAGLLIQGVAALNYPDYAPQPWHSTLLTWAVVICGFIVNTVLVPLLPTVELFFFAIHVLGWAAILITLGALAPMNDPRDTFLVFRDTAGWDSVGLAAAITMANSTALFIGYEAPVHMCRCTRSTRLS